MQTPQLLVDALRALCDREGGHKHVAMAAGVSAENLWQILHGITLPSGKVRGVGRVLAQKLDAAFPGWTSSQHLNQGQRRGATPVAHVASYPELNDPPLLVREDLLKPYLPPLFRVAMTDDSMAPWLLEGDLVKFRTDAAPVRGQPVLLKNAAGALFVRLYRERTPGHWSAVPLNPAFDALDSQADGLSVLGVFVGMDRP